VHLEAERIDSETEYRHHCLESGLRFANMAHFYPQHIKLMTLEEVDGQRVKQSAIGPLNLLGLWPVGNRNETGDHQPLRQKDGAYGFRTALD
jgi:hypothetical protein